MTEQPTSVVQGVSSVAGQAIGAFRSSPGMLLLLLLNAAFVGAAAYYLGKQQQLAERLVGNVLSRCLPDVHGEAYIAPPGGLPQMLTPQGLKDLPKPPLAPTPTSPEFEAPQ